MEDASASDAGAAVVVSHETDSRHKQPRTMPEPDPAIDPLLRKRSDVVREGDYAILVFADNKRIFVQCLKRWKGRTPAMKFNKRTYSTANLIGLPYGTVLELGRNTLKVLPEGAELLPKHPTTGNDRNAKGNGVGADDNNNNNNNNDDDDDDGNNHIIESSNPLENDQARADDNTFPPTTGTAPADSSETSADTASNVVPSRTTKEQKDNRNIVDDNNAQTLGQATLRKLREAGTEGSAIVNALIQNSSTFQHKTEFSKAKYIAKKQMKYQQRCRIIRCTAATICETYFSRGPRLLMNMREDSLGQILSYSNISAGCQCLVFDTVMGIVTGALAQRMGGYGKIFSIYTGQQPNFTEVLQRFNLSFGETNSIRWIHSSDAILPDDAYDDDDDDDNNNNNSNGNGGDIERHEREQLKWPCPLQDHTRHYMKTEMKPGKEQDDFLGKRCARFARKLTRFTAIETRQELRMRPSDSLVIVTKYDPTSTLMDLFRFLSPSSPFVVYCEFIEPLTQCFRELQKRPLAINLRLMDTWMRDYQVLPGRTHPSMNMSQSGGFILTGIKLCPTYGHNELGEDLLKEIRAEIGGRRGRPRGTGRRSKEDGDNDSDKKAGKAKRRSKRGRPSAKPTTTTPATSDDSAKRTRV